MLRCAPSMSRTTSSAAAVASSDDRCRPSVSMRPPLGLACLRAFILNRTEHKHIVS